MLESVMTISGLVEATVRVVNNNVFIPLELDRNTRDRALSAEARFRQATRSRSGEMLRSWRTVRNGMASYSVVNGAERKGFSYPAAQITGTGDKGQRAEGMWSSFNQRWHGMGPNTQLRLAWIDESNRPMVMSKLFWR